MRLNTAERWTKFCPIPLFIIHHLWSQTLVEIQGTAFAEMLALLFSLGGCSLVWTITCCCACTVVRQSAGPAVLEAGSSKPRLHWSASVPSTASLFHLLHFHLFSFVVCLLPPVLPSLLLSFFLDPFLSLPFLLFSPAGFAFIFPCTTRALTPTLWKHYAPGPTFKIQQYLLIFIWW